MEVVVPRDWELLAQGAEARVYLARGLIPGEECSIVKDRFEKRYRHSELDARLSKQRFNGEVRSMLKAAKAGIDVPRLDFVDKTRKRLIMEFIRGKTLKRIIDDTELSEDSKIAYVSLLGKTVATLHNAGMVHGDLTTSNIMVRDSLPENVTVIDFGLAFSTKASEDMSVDLYVLQRAFQSTHPKSEHLFEQVLSSYVAEAVNGEKIRDNFLEVQQRGRKRVAFG